MTHIPPPTYLVSYAQNQEDIVLWRALRHVQHGFYVDVGANDPSDDSVTRLFYDRGWRGINVEPSPEYFARLHSARPRDINLACAAGDHDGSTTFYDTTTRGWSTSDATVGSRYVEQGQAEAREVEQLRLDTILARHHLGEIHFLKVDVEGAEAAVLRGLSLEQYRPWIIVVEALDPVSKTVRVSDWEPRLLANGYTLVYFDGLNRFYLAREHSDLATAFAAPPNVLDGYRTSTQVDLERSVGLLQGRVGELESKLNSVLTSFSWRLTKPLRLLNAARRDLTASLKTSTRTAVRKVVAKLVAKANRSPRLKQAAVGIIRRVPGAEYRIRSTLAALREPRLTEPVVIAELADRDERVLRRDDLLSLPLPRGSRTIYMYVEHTANCPTNTGVQRVARGMAKGLIAQGERVRFVKWHAESRRCLLINATERAHLARWNGPELSDEERDVYPPANQPQIPVPEAVAGENNWLIVPEVTHITYQPEQVTLDLLLWAKRAGMKSGFVFYDAIPLRRPEFQELAPRHALYMQQLLLADVVWPISDWAKADLQSFWLKHECADARTMPEVQTQALSGESLLCERVRQAQSSASLILSVGTIEPRKNQLQLIRAFEAYCAVHPDTPWRLTLVGNLHPSLASEVAHATRSGRVKHLGHVTDEELDRLYQKCAFTVFPSVEEGFGLPILESLWYGKPCICANFGSMAEVAREGGCLMVDTREASVIEAAIARLIGDEALRQKLSTQATTRPIKTWHDYACGISARVETEGRPAAHLGTAYYWVDATLQFPKNTGIQRVTRQLARSLIEGGVQLVPVKWDEKTRSLGRVETRELAFLEQWNGPCVSGWQAWEDPAKSGPGAWFIMPELPLNRTANERTELLKQVRSAGLNCCAVFYDAIPWKMRRIYPSQFAQAHRAYMLELNEYDLVLPISAFSKDDLVDFLGAELPKPQSLSDKVKAVSLAGEFPESPRPAGGPSAHKDALQILCVGTVEPRKNHEALLRAFSLACELSPVPLNLTIAGGSYSIEPALAERVRSFVADHPNVTWEENADDARLRQLHLESDFTVYPSVEEGFGLPILESLWYARPCICADFGAMREVAEGGGCLMVDVRHPEVLAAALVQMATEPELRERLVREALGRPFKSWADYATEVGMRLAEARPTPALTTPSLPLQEAEHLIAGMHLDPRPRLSVCISTYNRAEWLAASLKNWARLYPQPLADVELLVCDNTSTDHTPDVVRPYLDRSDFSYHRNPQNVGMLGNLRETAHRAKGQYVWILGDDDLLLPGAVERVLKAITAHPGIALVYLNYAFTREEDARKIKDFDAFFAQAQPIVSPEGDKYGPIRSICARNENFFTAIYTLVFRRDHAMKAYSQDTNGRPFSSMPTCIPTTTYVLGNMMEEPGLWIGTPQVVVNLNVSWVKYAPLWILERVPEVYEVAERRGVPSKDMDRWRAHTLPGVVHYFQDIYRHDPLNNAAWFSAERLVRRFKHLTEFAKALPVLKKAYSQAHAQGHPAARRAPEKIFPEPGRT